MTASEQAALQLLQQHQRLLDFIKPRKLVQWLVQLLLRLRQHLL